MADEFNLLDFASSVSSDIAASEGGHAERAHSSLGASSCYRWWNCPGSIYLSKGIPSKTSLFAREGTVAHELSQKCLEEGVDMDMFLGQVIDEIPVTEEMVEAVQEYIEQCRVQISLATMPPMIETRISLERLNPPSPMFGTDDFMCVQGDTLVVMDLKYGKGVKVSAKGNPQLKYYALGGLYALPDTLGIKKIRAAIIQPRVMGYSGPDWAEYDILEIMEWSVELIDRAKIAMQPDAKVEAGSWCKFCPATGLCPVQADKALKAAQDVFSVEEASETVLTLPAISKLTPKELAYLLQNAKMIEDWIEAARNAATALLTADASSIPGWEMGPKRGQREWLDEDEAAKILLKECLTEDLIYSKSIISPANAETILSKRYKEEGKAKTLKAGKELAKVTLKHFNHSVSSGLTLRQKTESSKPEDEQ